MSNEVGYEMARYRQTKGTGTGRQFLLLTGSQLFTPPLCWSSCCHSNLPRYGSIVHNRQAERKTIHFHKCVISRSDILGAIVRRIVQGDCSNCFNGLVQGYLEKFTRRRRTMRCQLSVNQLLNLMAI